MQKFHVIQRAVTGYLVIVGILAHFAAIVVLIAALKYFQITPNQLLVKAVEKSQINMPWLVETIAPKARFSDHILDGQVRAAYPRILLPELSNWSGHGQPDLIAKRIALFQKQGIRDFDPCVPSQNILMLATCWISSGNSQTALQLIAALKDFPLQISNVSGNYGNGWQMAFAYDLVAHFPGITTNDRMLIESKIEHALQDYLRLLDDPSPSLWHGRASLAAMAWLTAVTLNTHDNPRLQGLVSRAQGHFLDLIRALEITEAWPEGYNYWIQNRGMVISLAASAYVNGLVNARHKDRILTLLRRIGLWHIYATRPDNRIENLGDEGSRVDLKDETRRVIDIIAQITRDPVFSGYSRYLQQLHGVESYYAGYRWGIRLFNDPTLINPAFTASATLEKGAANLTFLDTQLSRAELFGRGGMNQIYIRSDWSPSATFISFRAGHTFAHHGHYDAGHFTVFKGAPLAINSSVYGNYMSANRLNYSIRTVAKNALLILRPNEKVQPNRFFQHNVADGGQRIVLPTGSAVQNVSDWIKNLDSGNYFAGGKINHFNTIDGEYTYVSSDLTQAYNTPERDEGGRGGKVRKVERDLLYLANEDRVLIYDRVESTDPSYTKKWLLHTVNRPQVDQARVLKGQATNGISETSDAIVFVQNDPGYLRIDRIYPEDAKIRLVGGPDYQFYVESDGDDSVLDGENFSSGASLQPWFDIGMWRIEIQPGAPRIHDEFFIVLSPSLDKPRYDTVKSLVVEGAKARGVDTGQTVVVFTENLSHGEIKINVGHSAIQKNLRKLYVLGMPIGMHVQVTSHGETKTHAVNASGVLAAVLHADAAQITLQW
ncbi:MAG: hypothetical protein KF888_08585 [Nitrosomonas sp.]|nr:hypothetical protein [Nitrosomonas sp.]